MRPILNSTLNAHNSYGIKLPIILRVGLSHLREHKSRHNFQDSLDAFYIVKQLFTSFSIAQITQINEKPFSIKLVTSNVLY